MPYVIALISPRTSGKTTNAAWLASALKQRGLNVKACDGDLSQQLTTWRDGNQWDLGLVGSPSRMLHRDLAEQLGKDDVVVIDVGHIEEHLDVARSALRIADLALINVVPTPADIERFNSLPMDAFLDDVNSLRPADLDARILLTRCQPGTLATGETRHYFTEQRSATVCPHTKQQRRTYPVMSTVVPAIQRYALTGVGMPLDARGSAHDELVTELVTAGLL